MGYCTYCKKDVRSSVTCNYCNNILTPRMDSKLLEQRRHNLGNTDKWQDTYGKKSFFNNGDLKSSTKSALMSSTRKRVMPQFNTPMDSSQESNLKSCSKCRKNQKSWSDQNFTIYKSVYYCKPCLTDKLTCPKCSNQVKTMDSQVTFQQRIYHSDCFQCFQCTTSLCDKDAVENAKGQPLCTSCQPPSTIERQPSPTSNPSISTPLLNSRSTTTNTTNPLLFQRTRRSSMFSRNLPLDSSRPASILLDKMKERNTKAAMKDSDNTVPSPIAPNRNYTMSTPLLQQQQQQLVPKRTESNVLPRKKKVIKKPCKECGEHVSKKDYRGLKTLSGEVVCYHTFCLKCARCYQSFDGLDFCTDGKNFYHTECPSVNDRKGSPCSLSEEDCPKTPPPTGNPHFDVVSGSPVLLPRIDDQNNQQNKKKDVTPDFLPPSTISCDTCNKPVTDTYLELCDRFYHQECLLCAGCKNSIPADQKLRKLKDNKLYCEGCATKKRHNSIFLSSLVTSSDNIPQRSSTITSPSDIFKSRSTNLPRLGGCRPCDGCKTELPVSDSHPGPNATRWHKKCLRCPGCKKQMDSSGHIKTDIMTKMSQVHCRECLDNMPRYNFVR